MTIARGWGVFGGGCVLWGGCVLGSGSVLGGGVGRVGVVLPVDDGVESVVRVSGVLHSPGGTVRLEQTVRPVDDVSVALFLLALHVVSVRVVDGVLELVLGMGVVGLGGGGIAVRGSVVCGGGSVVGGCVIRRSGGVVRWCGCVVCGGGVRGGGVRALVGGGGVGRLGVHGRGFVRVSALSTVAGLHVDGSHC